MATIEYCLREGLLPPGRATSATRARYDEGHLHRPAPIRALTDVVGLSVAEAKVVRAIARAEMAGVLGPGAGPRTDRGPVTG